MNRVLSCALGLAVALLLARAAQAQPDVTYTLGIGGPCGQTLEAFANSSYNATLDCTLTTSDNNTGTGAQGWSISVGAENASITAITVAGTVAAPAPDGLQSGGFEKTELTSGDGNEGAVSAIVLSFTQPITLPEDFDGAIAKIDVEATYPATDGDELPVRLFMVDGRQGAGQPVDNNVTHEGATVKPVLGECAFTLLAIPVPPACPNLEVPEQDLQIVFQDAPGGDSADLFAGFIANETTTEDPGEFTPAPGETQVFAAIVSQLGPRGAGGVQGWSLSIGVGGDISLTDATTAGTVGAPAPDGLQSGGFEKTEVVDPDLNAQGQGAVSAVVLSFTQPITLQESGTATVLALSISGEVDATGTVGGKDGLQGAGQPVANVATVGGGTVEYACIQDVNVTFVEPPVAKFIAAEVNADGKLNIADPIYIVNALFRDGPAVGCPVAADANGDGMMDLSDAVFILEYLWLGGDAPSGPTSCDDAQPALLPEDCPAGSTVCP